MGVEAVNTNKGELVELGRITSLYGVRGWVKVFSHTEPMENILNYTPWQINLDGQTYRIEVEQGRRHGKGLVAKLAGVEDRDQAARFCGAVIRVQRETLPELTGDEFYWHQLEDMTVLTESGVNLGRVDYLIATGSNDVLVVKGKGDSIDRRERLIPYLPEQVIKAIDLEQGTIRVDWDPEF